MSRRSFRWALLVVVATFATLTYLGVRAGQKIVHYPDRPKAGAGKVVSVTIKKNMTFNQVARQLAAAGVIDDPMYFRIYGLLRGKTEKVKAAKYELRDDLTPREVFDALLAGVPEVTVKVTIPEGLNMREVFERIEEAGIANAADLEALARDPQWLKSMGIEGDSVEGYLFPETYDFIKPSSPKYVLERLVKTHRVVYADLAAKHEKSLAKLKDKLDWSDREIVIMASLVEKETGQVPGERPIVASVFYNRLLFPSFKPHKLETDPTIRYGCMIPLQKSSGCVGWDPSDRLHRKQLDDEANPYNTYQHEGLPPGPISNPGRASLEAAMAPDSTQYLFFVAKDDHSHAFAKTREEHERNVDKYIRGQ